MKTAQNSTRGHETVSGTSLVKRRTAADMNSLRATILRVADDIREGATITLRQLYYALTVRSVLSKTEADYKRLAHICSQMRRSREMPYSWIEDGTRITHGPDTYASARDALADLAERYLESPWSDADTTPEIWLEKDALSGVVYDVTYDYCVPLRVQRGYASLSAIHKASRDIENRLLRDNVTQVYYLRDLDPSGADAARAAEATLREMLGYLADKLPPFRVLGVTPEQVRQWNLLTRPNKATDSRSASFSHATSVELDAIEPRRLRKLVKDAITHHLSAAEKRAHDAQVETTRTYLSVLAEAARN